MAWYDTLINGANTLGNLYNAAKPIINTGAAIYDRNNTRGAITDAFEGYRGFANNSLNALNDVYREGVNATSPYRTAGSESLTGYKSLLTNPDQIVNNPWYKFRLNQGLESVDRRMAGSGYLKSGNRATALTDYAQGAASQEYDNALNRYLPMVTAGLTATGQMMDAGRNYAYGVGHINEGLGDAIAGANIGKAGATSDMLSDILGLGSSSSSGIWSTLNSLGESVRNIGQNTWANPLAGPRTTPKMPAKTGALTAGNAASLASAGIGGTGLAFGSTAGGAGALGAGGFASGIGSSVGAGTASTLPGMGATTGAFNSATAHIGAQGLSAGSGAAAGASGAGTTGATSALGGAASALGVAGLLYGAIQLAKMSKGGSVESAKTPKLYAQLQRDQAADPSGATTKATVDRLLRGNLWPGEGNQWVVKDLLSNGVITWQYPTLYASDSVVNINDLSPGNNKEATLQTFVELAGMPDEDAQKLQAANKGVVTALRTTINKSEEGYDSPISIVKKRKSETEYNQIIAKYMPQAVEEATKLRARIKAVDPSADLAKLDIFIAKNSR